MLNILFSSNIYGAHKLYLLLTTHILYVMVSITR